MPVATEEHEAIVTRDGKAYCSVCKENLPNDTPKGIKQHLKSKTHKACLQGGGPPPDKKKKKRFEDENEDDGDDGAVQGGDSRCELCARTGRRDTVHTLEELEQALADGEEVSACFAPPWQESARGLLPGHRVPFMTPECGSIPAVPDDLDECLQLYCNAGVNEGNKPPNVDIGGVNESMKSMSKARMRLQAAAEDKEVYWAALVVDAMKHPPWWPRPKDPCTGAPTSKCVAHGDVPCFNQVIVGAGPTDIGIHIDKAPCPPCIKGLDLMYVKDGEECKGTAVKEMMGGGGGVMGGGGGVMGGGGDGCCSVRRVHVDTYITMALGAKIVVMLPGEATHLYGAGSKFPLPNDLESIRRIREAGGYYFTLEPPRHGGLTLFTPKGWHHWLLGYADWHVIYGASRF